MNVELFTFLKGISTSWHRLHYRPKTAYLSSLHDFNGWSRKPAIDSDEVSPVTVTCDDVIRADVSSGYLDIPVEERVGLNLQTRAVEVNVMRDVSPRVDVTHSARSVHVEVVSAHIERADFHAC